jgi:hypothetical protein
MTRRLLNLLTLVSLLLCVAALALWLRSYLVSDRYMYGWRRTLKVGADWTIWNCEAGDGVVLLHTHHRSDRPPPPDIIGIWDLPNPPLGGTWFEWEAEKPRVPYEMLRHGRIHEFAGFVVGRSDSLTDGVSDYALAFPHWSAAVVFAILPAAMYRPSRRHRPGLCRACGYDLTGNVSGVCPECGEAKA